MSLYKRVLLLTGSPGIGKTTLIKAIELLKARGVSVGGMISREVREGGVRVGFEIVDLTSGKHGWLANINQQGGPKVGKYHVNLEDLEGIGAKTITEAVEKCSVVAVDEIGPMELYSPKFKQAVKRAFDSGKPVMAVVHAKAKDPLVTQVKRRIDAQIFNVTFSDREKLPELLTIKAWDTD